MTFALFAVHALQPDAGQATPIAAAIIAIYALKKKIPGAIRFHGIAIALLVAARAWTSLDPLEPVSQVEDILHVIADEAPPELSSRPQPLVLFFGRLQSDLVRATLQIRANRFELRCSFTS